MRTHLEFRSNAFPACPGEDEEINPGRWGRRLAEYLVAGLPKHGFEVLDLFAEDWGWQIDLRNDGFPLWIGVGNYEEYDDGFLCFIEPSKPYVGWLKRRPTADIVERLASALEQIVRNRDDVRDLRWWSESEIGR